MIRFVVWVAAGSFFLLFSVPVKAHHGVAAVSIAGPEGPGAAVETSSPLPLPVGMAFALFKSEFVSFRHFAGAEPENKDVSLFNILAVGYGIRPWLSAYVFQPYNMKEQDSTGRNAGLGDTRLMVAVGFKYDEGLRLVPEKESLDELLDWHFSVWISPTLPVGSTERTDRAGNPFSPDMQTGFGELSASIGAAVMKQVSDNATWLLDTSYQYFPPHSYTFTRYQFGAETRLNTAFAYRVLGRSNFRVDIAAEVNGLHIRRDRERDDAGQMEQLRASGGAILYGGAAVRVYWGSFSAAIGARRSALKSLNEVSEQQGSEGLENFRAAGTVSYARRF